MKIGQYTTTDGKFRERYLVRKIMKKTAIVTSGMSINYSDFNFSTSYRYPLELLNQQMKTLILYRSGFKKTAEADFFGDILQELSIPSKKWDYISNVEIEVGSIKYIT